MPRQPDPPLDPASGDALYKPFPSYQEFAASTGDWDQAVYDRYLAILGVVRQRVDTTAVGAAVDQVPRAAAVGRFVAASPSSASKALSNPGFPCAFQT